MKVLALLALFFILPFIQCAQIIADEPTDYIIRHASSSGLGCSLRGAIMNANRDSVYDPNCPAGSGSDEIMLTTDFTFVQSTRGEEQAESGDLDITSSIIVTGSGAKRTINANSLDRIFDVKGPGPNITLTLNNLILTNGHDNGFPGQYVLAAAVRAANSSRLFMDNVDFISNFLDLSNVFEAARGSAGVLSQGFVVGSNIVWRDNVVSGLILSGSQISAAMSLEYDRDCVLQNFTLDSNRVTLSPPFQANIAATGGIGLFGDSGLYGEGGKAYNNIGITGGAFYTSSNSQELHLDMVDDIYGNSADVGGVLSHHSPHVMVLRMSDLYSIRDNRARLGGGIFGSNGILILEHFNEIRNNTATVQGGFARTTDMNFVIHYGLKITNNVAGSNGGFIWTQRSDVNITDVDEITNNVAQNQGGLIYIQNQSTSPTAFGVLVQNVTLLSNNRAEVLFTSVGGAIASYSAPVVVRDITEISFHHAYRGAFIYQKNTAVDTFTVLVHDIAIIQSNRAEISDGAGGLVYSEYANVTLSSVTGIIKNNTAHSGDGALVFVENAHALVTDISCNITDNFAFSGFIAAVSAPVVRSTATFTNFVGNIINNDGFFTGGALACAGTNTLCQIDNVVGDFIDTECGSGCVIYSEGSAILQNVVGNFERNNAHFDGGLIYANDIVVLNIDGIISTNAAEQGSGGVFFAESSLQVSGVRAITSNFAKDNGGVAFSNGTITYDKVCQTSNNQVEDGTASVAWANNTITITFSSFSNNISPQFFSRFDNVVNNPFTPLSASISITGATSTSYIGQVFPSGGSGTYSYLWNSGATGQIDSSINTAAVSVEVTDDTYCSTTAFFTIPNPIANAGPDFIACPAQRFTLGGNPTGSSGVSGINATMHYSWAPASLIVNGLSTGASLANPLGFISDSNNPSTFTVVVTDVATGLIAVDSVIVSPLPVTVNAGADQSICAGHSVTLGGSPSASSPNNYTFRYTWEPQNGLIGPTTANPIASPIQTTTYTLFVATDGCRALSAADTVTVTVNSVSSVLAIASPDEPKDSFFICLGDSITLGGDSFGVPDEIFYEWSPAEGLDDPTSAHPVASPTVTTTYTLTVYNFGRCSQDTDVVTVVVSDLSVDAGDDLLTSGLLGGVPTATGGKTPYAYAWTPSAGLTNSQLANPNARPTISTAYTVTVTDSNSCQRTDTVNVIVRNDATSGYTSLRISYLGDDEPGSLAVVKSQIQHTIAEVLNIPPLAVDVQSITELNVEYWEVNVVIYQFGPTGDDLVDELMVTFGCIPNRLPCVVDASLSLMSEIGWDYLEFIAPPEIDKSSWYKYTSLDTLSFITPDTPRVSKYTFDSSVDDDVDFASIFTSMLLDDDDDENFSDFISGNDDDDDNVFNLPSYSFAPNTYLSSLLVVETSPAALITIPLLLATIFLMLLV